MSYSTGSPTSIPPGSVWGSVRQFYDRGGFVNGLNPAVTGRIWYVDTINGSNGNSGRAPGLGGAFATVAKAFANIDSYDIVVIDGVVTEQVVAPLGVFDVTLLGGANLPRQATNNGVPTGGGSYWKPPSSPVATTPLLELIEQGWVIRNICFNPHTSSPAIQGTRAEDAVHPDPSHLLIDGCYFVGGGSGQIGFQDSGGLFNVIINNCWMQSLATAIKGIAGAGIATPLRHQYSNNYFLQNTNDIVIGSSYGRIQNNSFKNTTTQKVDLTAGGHEIVTLNFFDDAAADIDPAHGYTGSSTGTWANYTTNQAALQVGQPA